MNRLTMKQTLFLVISTISLVGSPRLHASDAQDRLKQLLNNRPELAKQFISPKQTQAAPVQKQPVQPTPKPAPKPVEKPWITEQEKNDINAMITILDTYTARVYNCLDGFFNKVNGQPYKMHITSFKNQLEYLRQNALQKFPHAKTPERQRLFTTFNNLTQALEKAQLILCQMIDQNYQLNSVRGVLAFASEFIKAKPLLKQQHEIVKQNVTILRGELRNPQAQDMLNRVNRLNPSLTKVFNYGDDKSRTELLSIMNHRLKR